MSNSTTKLQSVAAYCRSFPDIAPVVQNAVGGLSLEPFLTICTDVMTDMAAETFNWKWNRFNLPVFYTNALQQDYALNVVSLGWLESGVLVDINNTGVTKPIAPLQVVKDLPRTSGQQAIPGQVCWLPNNQLVYGSWAAATTFISPIGVPSVPANSLTQIQDSHGNFWLVTTYGTTGSVEPSWPTAINYPTLSDPDTAATTVTDGSVVWTAINPNGQGIRCNPLPGQGGPVYQFNLFGQYRPLAFSDGPFSRMDQTIDPIPDDFAKYFRAGVVANAYLHSPDKGIRAKYTDMYKIWRDSLTQARMAGAREPENNGFYPGMSLTQSGVIANPGPAYPYPQN